MRANTHIPARSHAPVAVGENNQINERTSITNPRTAIAVACAIEVQTASNGDDLFVANGLVAPGQYASCRRHSVTTTTGRHDM